MFEPTMEDGVSETLSTPDETPASWKRFQEPSLDLNPQIVLDAEGSICHISWTARRFLEYRNDQPLQPCFFSHVHAKNQYRVMRDIADMVCHGKKNAAWLLRLRTGQHRWRWFKATAQSQLMHDPPRIAITLQELRHW